MINEAILNYILLFVFLEFYEISWQKAPSIMGMLLRMYKYYSKSIFLFLVMQPTFYFAIGFAMLSNYHPAAMILLLIKLLILLQRLFS